MINSKSYSLTNNTFLLLVFTTVFCFSQAAESEKLRGATFSGFVLPHYENDLKVWELRGGKARFDESDNIQLDEPVMLFFDSQGEIKGRFTSLLGIYETASQRCSLLNDVKGQYGEITLTCTKAVLEIKEDLLLLPGIFQLSSNTYQLQSSQGQCHLDGSSLKTLGPVTLKGQP